MKNGDFKNTFERWIWILKVLYGNFETCWNVVLWMIYSLKRVAKWRLDTGNKLLKGNVGQYFRSFTWPFSIQGTIHAHLEFQKLTKSQQCVPYMEVLLKEALLETSGPFFPWRLQNTVFHFGWKKKLSWMRFAFLLWGPSLSHSLLLPRVFYAKHLQFCIWLTQ